MATYSYADNGRRTGRTLGDTASTATTWTYGRDDNLPTAIRNRVKTTCNIFQTIEEH